MKTFFAALVFAPLISSYAFAQTNSAHDAAVAAAAATAAANTAAANQNASNMAQAQANAVFQQQQQNALGLSGVQPYCANYGRCNFTGGTDLLGTPVDSFYTYRFFSALANGASVAPLQAPYAYPNPVTALPGTPRSHHHRRRTRDR